jgi:myosin heavy subunit
MCPSSRNLKHSLPPASSLAFDEAFVITHYAGEVVYATSGWLDKNNAELPVEVEQLFMNSTHPIVSAVSALAESGRGSSNSAKKVAAGAKTAFTSVAKK